MLSAASSVAKCREPLAALGLSDTAGHENELGHLSCKRTSGTGFGALLDLANHEEIGVAGGFAGAFAEALIFTVFPMVPTLLDLNVDWSFLLESNLN